MNRRYFLRFLAVAPVAAPAAIIAARAEPATFGPGCEAEIRGLLAPGTDFIPPGTFSRALARTHAKAAVDALAKIASGGTSETARVMAASNLLSHGFGAPAAIGLPPEGARVASRRFRRSELVPLRTTKEIPA